MISATVLKSEGSSELPRNPLALDSLLRTTCQCHAKGSAHGEEGGSFASVAPAASEPQLSMRTLRPIIQHVRMRAQGYSQRFDHWNNLHDDDRVPVEMADAWLGEASRWLRDPALGLHALTELKRGCGDVVELAAECAPTLGDALNTVIRYAHLLCEAADFHLHIGQDVAALELRYTVTLSHVMRDFVAGAMVHALRSWLGGVSDFELWFAGSMPTRASVYEAALSPLRVHFGASSDAVVFPAALLNTPLQTADRALHAVLLRSAESLVSARSNVTSLSDQVRRLLTAILSSSDGNAQGIAKTLGMSQRSLARRLQQEGVSFSELLESVRKERALYYLERSNLAPQQIAHLLGYSNTATFCRAFARWQGQSPLRHRNAHAAGC
jgi:AraC-like DNA-binding protein